MQPMLLYFAPYVDLHLGMLRQQIRHVAPKKGGRIVSGGQGRANVVVNGLIIRVIFF